MSAKEGIIRVASQNPDSRNKSQKESNCMCKSLKLFFALGKFTGLLPIQSYNQEQHKSKCLFRKSKVGILISIFLLILYVPYVFFMYGKRLICGPKTSTLNTLEWYVMTFGYIIVDMDSISSVFLGLITINNICNLFEEISMDISEDHLSYCKKVITASIAVMVTALILLFSSYVYVAWIRNNLSFGNYGCTLVDQPFAVIIRGLTLIFPSTNTLIILVLSTIIVNKFEMVSENLPSSLQKLRISESTQELEKVANLYETAKLLVNKINRFYGVQLLVGLTSSLYTTIYYLYRYTTASKSNKYTLSSSHEKLHYLLGTVFRSSKILIFIVMGYKISNSVQLLLMIWQDDTTITLSSMGVVNIGPWLLAPIVGNVITYLLVALQFKTSDMGNQANVTKFLEFLF